MMLTVAPHISRLPQLRWARQAATRMATLPFHTHLRHMPVKATCSTDQRLREIEAAMAVVAVLRMTTTRTTEAHATHRAGDHRLGDEDDLWQASSRNFVSCCSLSICIPALTIIPIRVKRQSLMRAFAGYRRFLKMATWLCYKWEL